MINVTPEHPPDESRHPGHEREHERERERALTREHEAEDERELAPPGRNPPDVDALWQEIGFHRPLSGVLYNLVIIFAAAGLGILLTVWLIPNYILPFPEALGFTNITMQVFAVYFTLLDLGIGASIQRFVAEENVRDPLKSIQYIQFFIWYQLFSGLGQVTFIAVWVLYLIPASELAYAMWFFLLYSTIQYPGMLGIFRGTLEAFQRYDKASLLGFIQVQLFENVARIISILLGRWWGVQDPAIGEVMGATIGSIIGTYLKDFVTALIAAHWVKPILRDIHPDWGIKQVFFVQFDRDVVKRCLSFGLRAMVPGLITPAANFVATFMLVLWLPNYSSVLGMFLMGEMLATMVTTFSFNGIGASVAEAYHNEKYELTRFYIQRAFRWLGIMGFFMVGLLFFGASLIGFIAGPTYFLVGPIIQHFLFFKLLSVFCSQIDQFFNGVGKPHYGVVLATCYQGTRLLVLWVLLVPFPSGWMALVYSIGIGLVVRFVSGWLLFNARILRVKLNVWQGFVAPFLAAVVEAGYIYLGLTYLHPWLSGLVGGLVSAILLVLVAIGSGLVIVYFPALAFFGGWDERSLEILATAMEMSGPSKPIIRVLYRITRTVAKVSPLHDRFPTDETGVAREIRELTKLRAESKAKIGASAGRP